MREKKQASKLFSEAVAQIGKTFSEEASNNFRCLLNDHPEILSERSDSGNFTLLHIATANNNIDAVKILLEQNVDVNDSNNTEKIPPMYVAITINSPTIIKMMLDKGGDIYLELEYRLKKSLLKLAAGRDNCSVESFMALLSKTEHMRAIFKFAMDDEVTSMNSYINDHSALFCSNNLTKLQTIIHELECIFLFLMNHLKFESAKKLFNKIYSLYEFKNSNWIWFGKDGFLVNKALTVEAPFIFPINYSKEKQVAILDGLEQIISLLGNPKQCVSLFKELNDKIAAFQPFLNGDLSKIVPGPGLLLHGSMWVPGNAPQENFPILGNTYGLLRFLMRKKLQGHGIETQDELYIFAGFVNPKIANAIVENGALFKEQFLMGSALLHGLYSHYLQWYLFSVAIEKNVITFQEEITLRDMLTAMIEVKTNTGSVLWSAIIDFIVSPNCCNIEPNGFNLGSPHRLNSLVCSSSKELPYLSGYLLNSFYKNIIKFFEQVEIKLQGNTTELYSSLVGAQALASADFKGFDLGYTNDSVERYYTDHSKTGCDVKSFDKSTGVLVKSAEKRFSVIEKEYNRLFCLPTKTSVEKCAEPTTLPIITPIQNEINRKRDRNSPVFYQPAKNNSSNEVLAEENRRNNIQIRLNELGADNAKNKKSWCSIS